MRAAMMATRINTTLFQILLTVITLIGFMALMGCGSSVDPDYQPATSNLLHPFESNEQHGEYLATSEADYNSCTECHGADLHGVENGLFMENGEKDRSCFGCHTESHELVGFNEPREHASFLRGNNWNMNQCYNCHTNTAHATGIDFGGSCNSASCHSRSVAGPQACNTCHGNRSADPGDPVSWAPPTGLLGERNATDRAVGVHRMKITDSADRTYMLMTCEVCHVVPLVWDDEGHIDDDTPGRAEVVFGFPANAYDVEPTYDYETQTCGTTHCHWEKDAIWTDVGGWDECGSCHALPPERPHTDWFQCYFCHEEVWGETGVVNPDMHVNGQTNLCSAEYCHTD